MRGECNLKKEDIVGLDDSLFIRTRQLKVLNVIELICPDDSFAWEDICQSNFYLFKAETYAGTNGYPTL